MTTELILRDANPSAKKDSPFSITIEKLLKGERLDIACPYINPAYLRGMLEGRDSWRLLTDVKEWLRSLGEAGQKEALEFIRQHHERIHYYPKLHAKVVIGDEKAFLGSANLTNSGLLVREEAAVLIDNPKLISELRDWFQRLWEKSTEPAIGKVEKFIKDPANARSPQQKSEIEIDTPVKNKRYRKLQLAPKKKRKTVADMSEQEQRELLIKILRKRKPSRTWIEGYFDLVREVIELTGDLEGNSPMLATTLRDEENRLPVDVGRRYGLTAFWGGDSTVGFILPYGFNLSPEMKKRYVKKFPFRDSKKKKEEIPVFIGLALDDPKQIPTELHDAWHSELRKQFATGNSSPQRKNCHTNEVVKAAIDLAYRKELLDFTFSNQPLTNAELIHKALAVSKDTK